MKKILALLITAIIVTSTHALVKEYHHVVQPFINAFRTNDKTRIAEFIRYPYQVNEYVESIPNKDKFIERFDEVFDEYLSNEIANSTFDDWSYMGWRGIMFKQGEIWIDEDGFRWSNHQTQQAKLKTKESIKNDKLTLNSLLRNIRQYKERWIIDSGIIRIDKQYDAGYRYAFWNKGKNTSELPDEVINNGTFGCIESEAVSCFASGGGTNYYTFTQGNKKYIVHPPGGITSESSPIASIEVYNNNRLVLDKYLCDTEMCMNRAKDESNNKLVFEGFRQWKR